jgi:hypothetical protein
MSLSRQNSTLKVMSLSRSNSNYEVMSLSRQNPNSEVMSVSSPNSCYEVMALSRQISNRKVMSLSRQISNYKVMSLSRQNSNVKVMSLFQKIEISYRKSDTGKDEFGLRAPVAAVVFVMVFNWVFYEKNISNHNLSSSLRASLSAYRSGCLLASLPGCICLSHRHVSNID